MQDAVGGNRMLLLFIDLFAAGGEGGKIGYLWIVMILEPRARLAQIELTVSSLLISRGKDGEGNGQPR